MCACSYMSKCIRHTTPRQQPAPRDTPCNQGSTALSHHSGMDTPPQLGADLQALSPSFRDSKSPQHWPYWTGSQSPPGTVRYPLRSGSGPPQLRETAATTIVCIAGQCKQSAPGTGHPTQLAPSAKLRCIRISMNVGSGIVRD